MTTKVQSDMVNIDGATVATVAAADKINFFDVTDSLVKEDTVQVVLDLVPAGGAWNLIGTQVADNSANLTVTGLSSTYEMYCIVLANLVPATDSAGMWLRCGDSSGVDSGASDYAWQYMGDNTNDSSYDSSSNQDNSDSQMRMGDNAVLAATGSASGEGFSSVVWVNNGNQRPTFAGLTQTVGDAGELDQRHWGGTRLSNITMDRIYFQFHSGNITTGRMSVYGIAHA